jgi:hypothetical protein
MSGRDVVIIGINSGWKKYVDATSFLTPDVSKMVWEELIRQIFDIMDADKDTLMYNLAYYPNTSMFPKEVVDIDWLLGLSDLMGMVAEEIFYKMHQYNLFDNNYTYICTYVVDASIYLIRIKLE